MGRSNKSIWKRSLLRFRQNAVVSFLVKSLSRHIQGSTWTLVPVSGAAPKSCCAPAFLRLLSKTEQRTTAHPWPEHYSIGVGLGCFFLLLPTVSLYLVLVLPQAWVPTGSAKLENPTGCTEREASQAACCLQAQIHAFAHLTLPQNCSQTWETLTDRQRVET